MSDPAGKPPSGPPNGPEHSPQWQSGPPPTGSQPAAPPASPQATGPQPSGPQPSGPQPTGWQQPGWPQTAAGGQPPMSPESERNWAMAAHLSGFAAAYLALGFLGPLIVMLTVGNRSPFVRRHAVEALNFNLSWLLYIVVTVLFIWLLLPIFVLVALGIAYLVLVILAAIEGSNGREYRYPLTIRLVK